MSSSHQPGFLSLSVYQPAACASAVSGEQTHTALSAAAFSVP